MGLTQDKWTEKVKATLGDRFKPDQDGSRDEAVRDWELVCGDLGATLESALVNRNLDGVMLLTYELVKQLCEKIIKGTWGDSEADYLGSFLEDLHTRLRVPLPEVKHLWYASQWHDSSYDEVIEFVRQDLDRATLCIGELRRGTHKPLLEWTWPWLTPVNKENKE
jgi:hypothetical protein